VLRDLIESEIVPVVRLMKIFRQALESKIVTNAHRVNAGTSPEMEAVGFDPNSGRVMPAGVATDFIFVEAPESEVAARVVVEMASRSCLRPSAMIR
jgi:exodeoxyribonuclease V alpha subunit